MKRKKLKIVIPLLLLLAKTIYPQTNDSLLISNIFDEALSSRIAYENLHYLCKNMKGRVTGSPQAAAAVEFTKQVMENMDLDSVYLQEVMVPNWNPGQGICISSIFSFWFKRSVGLRFGEFSGDW